MVELGNILVGGIVTGAIYALLAIGFTLIFNVTGVLALAQGAFVSMGALTMYSFLYTAHMPIVAAFLATMVVILAVMAIIEWVIIRPAIVRISHTNLLMLMGGLLTAFEGAAFLIWGSTPYTLKPFTAGKPFDVGGVIIASQDIWVLGTMVLCVVVLWAFLTKTPIGRGMRATSENMDAARLMGVPVERMILLSFVISALLGVIAGAVIAPVTSLDYSSMASFTNDGLIAVTLGGLGSIFGSLSGGLVLGVVLALLSGYVSSVFGTAFGLVLLVVMLAVRPQGLLGRIRGARADVAARTMGKLRMPVRLPRPVSWSGMTLFALVMLVLPTFMASSKYFTTVNIVGIFCLALVGLELVTGIAGQVSLGQAGFMAIGGYTAAILVVDHHVTWILGMLAGIALSIIAAVIIGLVGSRVRGMYMAIVTLAFGIFVQAMGNGLSVTGGPSGLFGIPSFAVFGYSFDTETRFYYLIWALVGVALVITSNIIRSSRGRIYRAMHEDDVGARSLGLNTRRAKVAVFVFSAILGSIAGTLYASYFHYFSPGMTGSAESLTMITMLVVGGAGTQFGPLLGVALLTFLPDISQSVANDALLIDGGLLVLALRFLPGGLFGGFSDLVNKALAFTPWQRSTSVLPTSWEGGAMSSEGAMATNDSTGGVQKGMDSEPLPAGRSPGQGYTSTADASHRTASEALVTVDGASGNGASAPSPGVETIGHTRLASRTGKSQLRGGDGYALRVQGLVKSFGGVRAVRDVSFDVPEGSVVALIGPNGAGKSTVFNLVTNIYRPDAGSVRLWGHEIAGQTPDQITSSGLFRTFQTSRVFRQLTVMENVLVGGYVLRKQTYVEQMLWARRVRRDEKDLVRRASAILDVVGLADRADEPAYILPLAAQKYLDVARALMSGAPLLMFDEPGAGMNDAESADLGTMMLAIREAGHSIVVVDHNMALVMGIADEVTVMDAGLVIAQGSPSMVQQDEQVIDAYFGREEATA